MSSNSEPYETAIEIKKAEKFRFVKSAQAAPESGLKDKKKFSPKDMKKIRKIKKMSFRPG